MRPSQRIKTVASVLLLITSQMVSAVEQGKPVIGRLFTGALEREQLNADRSLYKEGRMINEKTNETGKQVVTPEFKYNGMLIRKNGSREIWVNGKHVNQSTYAQGNIDRAYRFEASRKLNTAMTLPGGQKIYLRPGQVYQIDGQTIVEAYQATHKNNESVPKNKKETTATETNPLEQKPDPAEEKPPPVEFDESILTKEISKIKLLEERIQELEKIQQDKVIRH